VSPDVSQWADALLAVLLAPVCGACEQPLLHPTRGCICSDCWKAVVAIAPPLCPRCGGHLAPPLLPGAVCGPCVRSQPFVARAAAIGPHTGALRSIVHALKYDGRRSIAHPLGALMRTAGADLMRHCEVAVPVPLHASRHRARGFNQAEDLARCIGLPVVRALARVRDTDTQTALPASDRHANVADAFRPTRRARPLRGAVVLLVDDVRTTGATLDACAHALKEAGVAEVLALTAARVDSPGS